MKRFAWTLALLLCLSAGAVTAAQEGDRLVNAGKEGLTFNFLPLLVHGKTNIVDFYSQFCPPCRAIMPHLERLTRVDPSYVVLRLDVNRPGLHEIDFTSPLCQQYKLDSLPHFKIFDASGKLTVEGRDAYIKVVDILEKHKV